MTTRSDKPDNSPLATGSLKPASSANTDSHTTDNHSTDSRAGGTSLLDKQSTGLIIIDVQGKLAEQMYEAGALFQQLRTLIAGAKLMELPIVWMEQIPQKLGGTREEIRTLLPGTPYSKHTFSGMKNPEIAAAIEQYDCQQWLVAGIEAHICVYQTVTDLLAQGSGVQLVTDAVSSRSAANKTLALQKMAALGAQLTSVEMALFELQQVAEGDVFRQLIKLVK